MKWAVGALVVGLVVIGLYAENQRFNARAVRYQSELILRQIAILQDENADLKFQLSIHRTYEEGLTDGLVRAKNIGYTDGYHAAITQMEETKAESETALTQ